MQALACGDGRAQRDTSKISETHIDSMNLLQFQTYYKSQQVPLQWLPFLRALACELGTVADVETLQKIMSGTGARFAAEALEYFENAQTLAELEQGLNEFWLRTNWGWVELKEEDAHVSIAHFAAPLEEAFGSESLGWSASVLEGFYSHVFISLGAKPSFMTHLVQHSAQGLALHFHFGEKR